MISSLGKEKSIINSSGTKISSLIFPPIYSLNLFFIHIPTYTTISYVCQCFFVNIINFLFSK
nr:MAG TPA: hypothetical protein [Caudoviricetes sp.]DAS60536.1 MAG TPA: hypothetical protein [Caudoviricetes sp.]